MSASFISGCCGPRLSPDERAFFSDEDPWGFILFKRNCETPEQVSDLVRSLRDAVGRPDAPILIDQEGGRVQRLSPPHWHAYPAARVFGEIFARDPELGLRAVWLGARLIASDLHALGIDVNCLPVLDLPLEGAHDVIGRRGYASEPVAVEALAKAAIDGLMAGSVLPVVKHIPGHGRAQVDSHFELPLVTTSRAILDSVDFHPFRALSGSPLGMTCHVLFSDIDPARPATLSPTIISEVVRGSIGFDGLLMTDDISMGALGGALKDRSRRALDADVDIVLHCSGDLGELREVAAGCQPLAGRAAERAARALAARRAPQPIDLSAARAEFDALIVVATT